MKFTEQQLTFLEDTFNRYQINTPLRKAHFMANCDHESMGFTRFIENLNYSAQGLANTFPKRYSVDPKAKIKQPNALAIRLQKHPVSIANNLYCDRMGNGNEASGDGWKHRGAGAIMITGKENQTAYFKSNNQSVQPELLQTFQYAIDSAGWFWKQNKLNSLADKDDTVATRKRVNGGLNGLEQVKENVLKYKAQYIKP